MKTETFRNKGAYSSGSTSVTRGACSISFFAYSSASLGFNDQINLCNNAYPKKKKTPVTHQEVPNYGFHRESKS